MKSLMVAVVAALCCAAFAEGPEGGAPHKGGPRGGMGRGMGPGMMQGMGAGMMMADPIVRIATNPNSAEKLGLSEEQVEKLKKVGQDKEKRREESEKMRAAMEKQAKLMSAEKIDEAAVMAAIDEVFELRKEMAKEQAKRVVAVRTILTPEQIKKATEEMKGMRGRGPQAGGKRGSGHRPEGAKPKAE